MSGSAVVTFTATNARRCPLLCGRALGYLSHRDRRIRGAPGSRAACALGMSRREMLGERQVAAPLVPRRAAHGALRPAHRRLQPGAGVGVQLGGLRPGGKPQRPSQCQFGHETPGLGFALITPAASRPGQHRAVRRRRGRQVAPCGHASTVGQIFRRPVLPWTRNTGAEHPVRHRLGALWRAGCPARNITATVPGEPVARQPQGAQHSAGVTAVAGRDGLLRGLRWIGRAFGTPGRGRPLGACPSRSG